MGISYISFHTDTRTHNRERERERGERRLPPADQRSNQIDARSNSELLAQLQGTACEYKATESLVAERLKAQKTEC